MELAGKSEMSVLSQSQSCLNGEKQRLEVEKKFPEIKHTQLQRPSSPALSVLSISSSDFLKASLVSSTPLPSEIDEESQICDELETDKSSDDETEKTIREFLSTPLIVEATNPFIPSLVRIPPSEVFEGTEKDETLEEQKTLQYEELEEASEATILERISMCYEDLDDEGERNDHKQEENVVSGGSRASGSFDQDPGRLKKVEKADEASQGASVPQDAASIEAQRKPQDYQSEESFESLSSCPDDYDGKVLSNQKNTEPRNHQQALELLIANFAVDAEIFLRKFPPVIRDETLKLQQQMIPEAAEPVYIAEVFSPVLFWFHFEQGVTELMKKMQEDYKDLKPQNLMISDENIKRGLLVACYLSTFSTWHRAMVVEPLNEEGMARLLYVDYGTAGMCHKSNIKFLYESYLEYPRYANRGRCFNLKPPGSDLAWSEKQINKFLFKFSNRELKATVLSWSEAENIYELDLTHEPSSGQAVNVRTWIISHGIATDFEVSTDDIYPFCYHFPTFDMLEKNFPSFHERSLMSADGINYDLLTETNFLANVSDFQLTKIPALLRLLGHKKFKKIKNYYFTEF